MTGRLKPAGHMEALSATARRWHWMPLTVLAVGVASIAMLITTDRIRQRLIEQEVHLIRVSVEIQKELATAHVWVEELVSGDEVDPQAIWSSLGRAAEGVEIMLQGGTLGADGPELEPLENPGLIAAARDLGSQVLTFTELSEARYDGYRWGRDVGVGSRMDRSYDRLFAEALGQAAGLQAAIEAGMSRRARQARRFFLTILCAWVSIVVFAVTGMWSRERRRQRAEAALERSQAQLLQAQKMDAVGRLAGGIAHDINNYLGAITAQCELVKRQVAPGGGVAAKMEAAIATVFKASALIRRLLAFSRREPVQLEVVNLNRIVEGLDEMLQRLIGEDVTLETRLQGELWSVRVDPAQMEQVIVNLLVNAREAMPTGGRVVIETANCVRDERSPRGELAAAGQHVSLVVSDTGTGIAPEIRDMIFEPFFTTKAESGSSGLGLAMVYGIVQQWGGQIWVYSEEGLGTTFKIYLPRSGVDETGVGREASRRAVAGGSEHILLVEDNDDLRRSTSALLEELGYEVTVAAAGAEALKLFEAGDGDIDLLITDVVMPEMSGRELADRIKRRRGGVPILFVSGYTDDVILRHGVEDGEVTLVQKPFSAEILASKVREALETRSGESPPAGRPGR